MQMSIIAEEKAMEIVHKFLRELRRKDDGILALYVIEFIGTEKLQIAGCVNSILLHLRRYLMIEKGVFEFNKFRTIEVYLRHAPPIVESQAFDFILKKLKGEVDGDGDDLRMLRTCGARFRDYFNKRLLNSETAGGHYEA